MGGRRGGIFRVRARKLCVAFRHAREKISQKPKKMIRATTAHSPPDPVQLRLKVTIGLVVSGRYSDH